MIEELGEMLLGPLGIGAVIVLATRPGKKILRKAAKAVVKAGYEGKEFAVEARDRINEYRCELVDEIKAEQADNGHTVPKKRMKLAKTKHD
jgi:predicted molibdopterin-dependent oxidoreductase YjgC